MEEFAINTPARQAAFLAQIGHESGSLRYVREIADGSAYDDAPHSATTARKRSRWRRRPARPRAATTRAGLIQITGYNNYRACSRDLLRRRTNCAASGNARDVAAVCPLGGGTGIPCDSTRWPTPGNSTWITKAINGGYNGMADRQAYHARAQKALASSEDAAGPVPFPEQEAQPVSEDRPMVPFVAAAPRRWSRPRHHSSAFSVKPRAGREKRQGRRVAVEIAKAVTEQKTAEGAVTALQADPELASTYAKAVSAHWYELAGEAGGGGNCRRPPGRPGGNACRANRGCHRHCWSPSDPPSGVSGRGRRHVWRGMDQ